MDSITPVQQKMFNLLRDGQPHSLEEFKALLWDDQALDPISAIRMHLSKLRSYLEKHKGLSVLNGQGTYRLVRLIGKQSK